MSQFTVILYSEYLKQIKTIDTPIILSEVVNRVFVTIILCYIHLITHKSHFVSTFTCYIYLSLS